MIYPMNLLLIHITDDALMSWLINVLDKMGNANNIKNIIVWGELNSALGAVIGSQHITAFPSGSSRRAQRHQST
jgi:hypothetical protein